MRQETVLVELEKVERSNWKHFMIHTVASLASCCVSPVLILADIPRRRPIMMEVLIVVVLKPSQPELTASIGRSANNDQ